MKFYLKYDLHTLYKVVVKEQMRKLDIDFTIIGTGEVGIRNELSHDKLKELKLALKRYGIEIMDDHGRVLVQRIKDAIFDMVHDENTGRYKLSTYLSEKLNYSYTHLSNMFPKVTHTSIEHYVILQKIDYAKSLIVNNNLTVTEVAHILNYSSPAHFSSQFKKNTGLTPSAFQRIMGKRK